MLIYIPFWRVYYLPARLFPHFGHAFSLSLNDSPHFSQTTRVTPHGEQKCGSKHEFFSSVSQKGHLQPLLFSLSFICSSYLLMLRKKCQSCCHCERSEAILLFRIKRRDCFVAKAPRNDTLLNSSH